MASSEKSTVEEIRQRFDQDVERFSNLETGQTSTVDAALALELIAETAAAVTPGATHLVDVGCGAGNYALKLLQSLPGLDVTLIDLSRPMLDRATERVSAATAGQVVPLQGDIRELDFGAGSCDIILAAAVLHHLRSPDEWRQVFQKFFKALRPGGGLWIFDLVDHEHDAVRTLQTERYAAYLTQLKDATYRDHVLAYVAREDTPAPLTFQLEMLRAVGFSFVDVLHKKGCFAAFGGVKS